MVGESVGAGVLVVGAGETVGAPVGTPFWAENSSCVGSLVATASLTTMALLAAPLEVSSFVMPDGNSDIFVSSCKGLQSPLKVAAASSLNHRRRVGVVLSEANGEDGVIPNGDGDVTTISSNMTSEADVNAALQALTDQVSALQQELSILPKNGDGSNMKDIEAIIDERLQELKEDFSDTTSNLQQDLESFEARLLAIEESPSSLGGTSSDSDSNSQLIQEMTNALRDEMEELANL